MISTGLGALTVHGLGASAELRVEGLHAPLVSGALRTAWQRCGEPVWGGVPAAPVTVQADLADASTDSLNRLLMGTTQNVTRSLIAARLGELFLFHAGAVCRPGGEALAFVAPGRTGKTTLARTLSARFGYLTDETVAVEFDGTIRPYPKPLSLRLDDGPKWETSPDELGLRATPASARLARFVFLRRDHPSDAVESEELGVLDAITVLAEQMSSLGRTLRGLQRLAALIDRTGPVLVMHYREAATLAPVLADMLEDAR
ncbi:MAG TPA: hypothetical protein VFN73_01235 [Propionibacteriaceae bacterium]|nr:hypothetical protein [Propionibacteriaceae bacterium]